MDVKDTRRNGRLATCLGVAFLLLFAVGQPCNADIVWTASGTNDGLAYGYSRRQRG